MNTYLVITYKEQLQNNGTHLIYILTIKYICICRDATKGTLRREQ